MDEQDMEHRFADLPPVRTGLTAAEIEAQLAAHPETESLVEVYRQVVALATAVEQQGGRVYLVGGAVRDEIMGQVPRDFDLEVHGLQPDELEPIITGFGGSKPSGKSFGTYKLGKMEVALPRRDSQTGARHTDVEVDVIPNLGITEAARRREYTIGAIYKDILTNDIYDPHHGIDDLEKKTLRMVDAKTFPDDALRVLRGVRQVARFELTIDPETWRAMGTMVERLGALSKDRVREEWFRLLTEARQPSIGIEYSRQLGILERWHPELAKLWQSEQDPIHHPEGNAGVHTMMVVDAAAAVAREMGLSREHRQELMLGAVTHDLGKPATAQTRPDPERGLTRITNYNHEAVGVKPAEVFLRSIGVSSVMIDRITPLVAQHMRPANLYRDRATISDKALRKLARDVGPSRLRLLVALAEADHRGRGPFAMTDGSLKRPDTFGYHAWWEEQITRLELDQPPEPILWGRDLVDGREERNWPPGPLVGEAVRLAQELAMDGYTRDQVLAIVNAADSPNSAVEQLRSRLNAE